MLPNVSRRRFLALSAAAAAGSAWLNSSPAGAQTSDRWGGFPIGVQSYSLREFKLPEVLRHLQRMQVKYVEFAGTHCPLTSTDDEIAQIVKMTHDAGLKISAHGVNRFTKDHDANRNDNSRQQPVLDQVLT